MFKSAMAAIPIRAGNVEKPRQPIPNPLELSLRFDTFFFDWDLGK